MPTLPFPKYGTGASASENLPTRHNVVGTFTIATPPVIIKGKGFTVTRQSQGVYRVTMNQKGGRILGADATLEFPDTTTEARFFRGTLIPGDANGYVDFVITDAAGAVQDAVGLDRLHFMVRMMLTKQPV